MPWKGCACTHPSPRQGGVAWLIAKNMEFSADFSVAVYPAKDASRQLGLRIQPSTHDRLIRLRNVVVSYASTSSSAARVKAALERLQRL